MEQTSSEGRPLQHAVRQPMTDEQREKKRELELKYRRWQCLECNRTYGYESDAANCCGPEMVYVCPTCEELWTDVYDAQQCELRHKEDGTPHLDDETSCPICREVRTDLLEAISCCLWKRYSFAERLAITNDLRFGRLDPLEFRRQLVTLQS